MSQQEQAKFRFAAHLHQQFRLLDEVAAVIVTRNGHTVDMLVTTHTGSQLAVLILDAPPGDHIAKMIEAFTAKNIYTLIFVPSQLIPESGTRWDAPIWARVLNAIYLGRIYTYTVGQKIHDVQIGAVHLHYVGGHKRVVETCIGLPLRLLNLKTVDSLSSHAVGKFKVCLIGDKGWWSVNPPEQPPKKQEQQQKPPPKQDAPPKQERTRRQRSTPSPKTPTGVGYWYSVIGCPVGSDYATAKSAYRRRARELHPDLNKAPDATQRMQELNAAWEKLEAVLR
jgi:hypothetical protein